MKEGTYSINFARVYGMRTHSQNITSELLNKSCYEELSIAADLEKCLSFGLCIRWQVLLLSLHKVVVLCICCVQVLVKRFRCFTTAGEISAFFSQKYLISFFQSKIFDQLSKRVVVSSSLVTLVNGEMIFKQKTSSLKCIIFQYSFFKSKKITPQNFRLNT